MNGIDLNRRGDVESGLLEAQAEASHSAEEVDADGSCHVSHPVLRKVDAEAVSAPLRWVKRDASVGLEKP